MKIKDEIGKIVGCLAFSVLFIIFLPYLLLYLLFKLIMTPVDYIKYKKSRYQQDFPHKFSWLRRPHADNQPYTAIKEGNLPVEYIKWHEEYDLRGYFVYKDILLEFDEPFFFDKKKGLWLIWPGAHEAEEVSEDVDDSDYENTDDCLTVESAKECLLDMFRENVPGRACNRVVCFYLRENVENNYEEGGLEKMQELDDFIIYEKGNLATAIKAFVESN